MSVIIPENYKSTLSAVDNEKIIFRIKQIFGEYLNSLNIINVCAPLCVQSGCGINDELDGSQEPVTFQIDYFAYIEIIHSLAKWKRIKIKDLDLTNNEGIYTNMNAIRKDENLDNTHSIFVDQWDWEVKIDNVDRNLETLKKWANLIYQGIKYTNSQIHREFNFPKYELADTLKFIHSEELLKLYPDKTPQEREYLITKKYKAVFICGIGYELSDNNAHDNRASDYDDWITENSDGYYGLNGDILIWNDILQQPLEITSMGIRVNAESLLKQLKHKQCEYKKYAYYHNMIINDYLPQTIGGGVGQSRLCMLLMQKAHIGEVQCGVWCNTEDIRKLNNNGIKLL